MTVAEEIEILMTSCRARHNPRPILVVIEQGTSTVINDDPAVAGDKSWFKSGGALDSIERACGAEKIGDVFCAGRPRDGLAVEIERDVQVVCGEFGGAGLVFQREFVGLDHEPATVI